MSNTKMNVMDELETKYPEFYEIVKTKCVLWHERSCVRNEHEVSARLLDLLVVDNTILNVLIEYKDFPWDLSSTDKYSFINMLNYRHELSHIIDKVSISQWKYFSRVSKPYDVRNFMDMPWDLTLLAVTLDQDYQTDYGFVRQHIGNPNLDWQYLSDHADIKDIIRHRSFPWKKPVNNQYVNVILELFEDDTYLIGYNEMKRERDELKGEYIVLEHDHNILKHEHRELKNERDELKRALSWCMLSGTINDKLHDYDELKNKYDELEYDHDKLKDEHRDLKKEHADLEYECDRLNDERRNLIDDNFDLLQRCDKFRDYD